MKRFFRHLITFLIFFWFFGWILSIYQELSRETESCIEYSYQDSTSLDWTHSRSWLNLDQTANDCMTYYSAESLRSLMMDKREKIQINWHDSTTHTSYWGQVYSRLILDNGDNMQPIIDSLSNLIIQSELSRYESAELIFTFVQDIPYTLITDESCEDRTGRCRPDEAFGILSPYEFMNTLQGDCDTRSVLLYILLKAFDFHPLIMISREYLHAMIALDIPAHGDFVEYQSEKYYFWETTSKGWRPGMLSPDTKNTDYWHIALSHEL